MTTNKKPRRAGNPGAALNNHCKPYSTQKLPPFGKLLIERQRFKNPPWLIVVCVGANAWQSAKLRNERGDTVALVALPDEINAVRWPVAGRLVVIEWAKPAPEPMVVELVRALLLAGAESVTVWPAWEDFSESNLPWKDKQLAKTYRVNSAGQGVAHDA